MGKRYFELVDGTSSKFWEVWTDGNEVRTRYGRIGAAGQTTVKDEGSPAAAKKLCDKLIAEKTKKGYSEGGASAGAAPKAAPPHDAALADRVAKIAKAAKAKGVKLNKGASEADIAKTEATLGVTFPAEVRAFYKVHDGGPYDEGVLNGGWELLSLENMVGQWKIWKGLIDDGEFEGQEGEPVKGIKAAWVLPEWIPITHNGGGDHDILDLAPGKGGTLGQVLEFSHEEGATAIAAKSFLAFLEKANWSSEDDDDEGGDAGGFRRFEMDEKFWAIKLEGSSFTVKFGKQGTDGQEKTKDMGSEAAAKKEHDKLVAEKTKKGYEEVEA